MLRILVLLLIVFQTTIFAVDHIQRQAPCPSKEACLNDPECLCWCSQLCGWRKKTPEDHPIYVENDPYGKFCYCKQWDYDYYKDNCIDGKNIPQPKGAK
jgi:hypothetical protein